MARETRLFGHGSRLVFDSRRVVKIDLTAYVSRRDRGIEGPGYKVMEIFYFISRQQEPREGVPGIEQYMCVQLN